jgi:hypothetical protein
MMHIINILHFLFYSTNNDTILVAHMNLYIFIVETKVVRKLK